MPVAAYTPSQIVQLGQERYDREIRPRVEGVPGNRGKMVALDVDFGDWELAADSLAALDGLKARRPEGHVYIVRVGYPTAVKLGVGRAETEGEACQWSILR